MKKNQKNNLIMLLAALSTILWIACSSNEADTSDSGADAQANRVAPTIADKPAETEQLDPKLARKQPAAMATAPKSQPKVAQITAVDLDGVPHKLSEWIGKKGVVINFWGTWCPPCRREIPGLVRLYDEYRERGVEIVSLAVEKRAGPAQVKQFTERAGMTWVQLLGNEQAARAFRYTGSVPTTVFLDKNGNEVARHIGGRPYEVFKPDFEKIAIGS